MAKYIDPFPHGEVPAWLEKSRQANRYYEFMRPRDEYTESTRSWPLARKKRYWAEIIARGGRRLDVSATMSHSWNEPTSDRLEVLVRELAARGHEDAFLEEMAASVRQDPRVRSGEPPLGCRWQHFSRFLGHRPVPPDHRRAPAGRLLVRHEFPKLLGSCLREGDIRSIRDATMFALCYGAAVTTCELASLEIADWDHAIRSLRLGRGYRSRGGFQDRIIELGFETADLLASWVCLRGRAPGRLFYSLDRYGAVKDERITGATVHAALRQRCDRADLPHIAPEDLRRTGLTDLLTSGADLLSVSDIAGNQSTEQTQRYLLPGTEAEGNTLHGKTSLHR